jgi:hypothetical protein
MTPRTEVTMRRQNSRGLRLVWRALESGTGSGSISPKADMVCPAYAVAGLDSAFPGTDRQPISRVSGHNQPTHPTQRPRRPPG